MLYYKSSLKHYYYFLVCFYKYYYLFKKRKKKKEKEKWRFKCEAHFAQLLCLVLITQSQVVANKCPPRKATRIQKVENFVVCTIG